jgi:hypothetical protein
MGLIWKEFEKKRGISNVGTAVNGIHVPWKPDDARYTEDLHNYKGWHSILVVAFVNSYYMFSGVEIGWAGRSCDTRVTTHCKYYKKLQKDPTKHLGAGGLVCI